MRSKVWFTTQSGRALSRSILFTTTMGLRPRASALRVTKRVCGIGPFDRVHEQHDAVDHREHALDLAAEVGVAGRVHDVDVHAVVVHGGVLGEDRDAPLLLDVARVHDSLDDVLVLGEGASLLQELVDERGLAVVDVGDDGDIAQGARHGMS